MSAIEQWFWTLLPVLLVAAFVYFFGNDDIDITLPNFGRGSSA